MQKLLLTTVFIASLCNMGYAACNSGITPTAPNSRYQLLNNGTEVKDLKTNLIWQRCSVGQTWSGSSCTGTATTYSWQNALSLSQNMAGGWRLPNIKELQSLVERACYNPSINQTIFTNTSSVSTSSYISSSQFAADSSEVWLVNFRRGDSYGGVKGDISGNYFNIRFVRTE